MYQFLLHFCSSVIHEVPVFFNKYGDYGHVVLGAIVE